MSEENKVKDEQLEEVSEDVVDDSEESFGVVQAMISELQESPELAVNLVHTLSKITKPWELIGSDGKPMNEIPVPPGQSATKFKQDTMMSVYVSGYSMSTIFGDNIALIVKESPKWKIIIDGEYQVDAPFVEHGQKAEKNAKEFAEKKLKEKGYVLG